jgi:hypothetical protein
MKKPFDLRAYQYQRSLEERRGNNFQYLNNETHADLERRGYLFDNPTMSVIHAKEKVADYRASGNHSRIVCWAQGKIRMREYIVIHKPK